MSWRRGPLLGRHGYRTSLGSGCCGRCWPSGRGDRGGTAPFSCNGWLAVAIEHAAGRLRKIVDIFSGRALPPLCFFLAFFHQFGKTADGRDDAEYYET